ncbi:MAG: pyridoxamine 5'-phosphate oxidase family protein [Epulopiscium sp.]|nr:pyridoxamine 5'-phosphate oxidase family protein [Candidatus Epulonipiscium sp.]
MFRKMRKSHMALSNDKAMEILKQGEYGIVSTIGEDGYPYGFPMSYIVLDGNIYFHCAMVGHKLANINYNEKVSFTVVGRTELLPEELDTNYESVIVFGRATKVEGEEKEKALLEIVNKYAKDFIEKGKVSIEKEKSITTIIKISIEHMTGKYRWGDIR